MFLSGSGTVEREAQPLCGVKMAGSKTGSGSVIRLSRKICKLVAIYGVGDLSTKATPAFSTAIAALVAACMAFEALDDQPGQIDSTEPIRAGEDQE
jgi:hypothetical protein